MKKYLQQLKEIQQKLLSVDGFFEEEKLKVFSFKFRKYVDFSPIDRSHILFELNGNLVYKRSVEAKLYFEHTKGNFLIKQNNNPNKFAI